VSVDAARDAYGVVIDVKSFTIDHAGTVKRREELRTQVAGLDVRAARTKG
jgi:hypothetical protein